MRSLYKGLLNRTNLRNVCVVLVMSTFVAGCGSGQDIPPLAQVSGTVTIDGKPVSGASVIFEPKFQAVSASGGTDKDGKFTLMYGDTAGAAIGDYIVRVFHYGDDPELPQESLVPESYGAGSTLTATVKEGENEIDFDLKGKKK
ncbi:carboxypeptidase-like regulatory domain-containing protein [uncultured Gimesia sp.]|uniref:carboxypeptidase-like regulatory domain-containing protein n=1 Tax=uncultured Gimesia sp. TaxID=1678688 RepID=UPI0030D87F75